MKKQPDPKPSQPQTKGMTLLGIIRNGPGHSLVEAYVVGDKIKDMKISEPDIIAVMLSKFKIRAGEAFIQGKSIE